MAGKSRKWRKKSRNSSSSSSENGDDPDYDVKWAERETKRDTFTSFKDIKKESPSQRCSGVDSATKGDTCCNVKKKERIQVKMPRKRLSEDIGRAKKEPASSSIRSSVSKAKRSNSIRGKRKLDFGTDQEHQCSIARNKRVLDNDAGQDKIKGSARRCTKPKNDNDQIKLKATIFSWLIDTNMIQEGSGVYCVAETSMQALKEGVIKREGVLCVCCNKVFTTEDFVFHAGIRKCRKPYEEVFISMTRISLLQCMIEAWNTPEERECHRFNCIYIKGSSDHDSHDDACMICADGGKLMCCEECSSTYHQQCIGMKDVPYGSWYCPYCICKFCKDPSTNGDDYLLTCPQCEKKYHWDCHQERESTIFDLNSTPCAPFCDRSCKEIYEKLEGSMVGVENKLDEGFSWTLLHRMVDDFGVRILDAYQTTLCHSKLAVARRLMEDSFEPILDRHTQIDVIKSVVYNCGANLNRINFKGFYTAVLEKDEEIITVASLRIHGTKLAEMPFIATNDVYRSKGMCKRLMIALESALCYLKVQNLVIPSTSERINNWIERYGFRTLSSAFKKDLMNYNTLMFHDSVRLQKALLSTNIDQPYEAREYAIKESVKTTPPSTLITKSACPNVPSLFDLNMKPPRHAKSRLGRVISQS